jgi:integrase
LVKVWNAAALQGQPHGTVVQLLILTGQRRGEVAAFRDAWIDVTERTITLPDYATKNGLEHTFPVGMMAINILRSIPRREECKLLFPTRWADDRPMSGWSKYKAEMSDGAVALVYNRYQYLPEMSEAIALWEKYLATLLVKSSALVKAA